MAQEAYCVKCREKREIKGPERGHPQERPTRDAGNLSGMRDEAQSDAGKEG